MPKREDTPLPLTDIFPPGFDKKRPSIFSGSTRRGHCQFTPEQLFRILTTDYDPKKHVEWTLVTSIRYCKQKSGARHEFLLIEFEDEQTGLENVMVLDGNQVVSSGRSFMFELRQAIFGFRISYNGAQEQLIEECQLRNWQCLEMIEFTPQGRLYLYQLVTLVRIISEGRSMYSLVGKNGYWFAGVIWECIRILRPSTKHDGKRAHLRGCFANIRYTPDEGEVKKICEEFITTIKSVEDELARLRERWFRLNEDLVPANQYMHKKGSDSGGAPDSQNVAEVSLVPFGEPELISPQLSMQEVFNLLLRHGCINLESKMDINQDTSVINGGGFGDIRRGKLYDGTIVAIKAWRASMIEPPSYKTLKRAAREVHFWSRLQHNNVHQLMGVVIFKGIYLGMVSEWMENGNLHEYMRSNPQLDRYQMCAQVASGVLYMHQCDVVHGDIKALNILVSSDGVAKLADFGLSLMPQTSLHFSETTNSQSMSTRWAAPELLEEGAAKSKQTDIYALGMTMLEIITGKVPYPQCLQDLQVVVKLLEGKLPTRPEDRLKNDAVGDQMWGLLMRCWDRDPNARPSAIEVAQMDFGLNCAITRMLNTHGLRLAFIIEKSHLSRVFGKDRIYVYKNQLD